MEHEVHVLACHPLDAPVQWLETLEPQAKHAQFMPSGILHPGNPGIWGLL